MKRKVDIHSRGFTLIELMVVVTVVALLAMIALPSYQNSVRKSRRTDARIALIELAQTLERCQTQFGRYDDSACVIVSPQDSADHRYTVTVVRDASSYTLSATAKGAQIDDLVCSSFSLNQLAERSAVDSGGIATSACW